MSDQGGRDTPGAVGAWGPPLEEDRVTASVSARLRDLAEARNEGLISPEEFAAAKANVLAGSGLGAAPTSVVSPMSAAALAPLVATLGWALVIGAVAVVVSYCFSWTDWDGFASLEEDGFGAGLFPVALTSGLMFWGGATSLRSGRMTLPVLVALPVGLVGLWLVPIVALIGVESLGGWAVVVYALAVAAATVAAAVMWPQSGWNEYTLNALTLGVGAVGSVAGAVFFFTDAFAEGTYSDSFGSRWDTYSSWTTVVSVLSLAVVVAVPLMAAMVRSATAGASLAAGAGAALVAYYSTLLWETATRDLSMSAAASWLMVAFGCCVALSLLRFRQRQPILELGDEVR